jgi:hypothetical protein
VPVRKIHQQACYDPSQITIANDEQFTQHRMAEGRSCRIKRQVQRTLGIIEYIHNHVHGNVSCREALHNILNCGDDIFRIDLILTGHKDRWEMRKGFNVDCSEMKWHAGSKMTAILVMHNVLPREL